MKHEEALAFLGIDAATPRSAAKALFKARALALYPNGYAPVETRDEFEQLTDAWQTVSSLLPHSAARIRAVGAAVIYDATPTLHTLERTHQALDIRL